MSVAFTPVNSIDTFRFWCQKILPAVYDDSLTYYELLAKIVDKLNEVIKNNNSHTDAINELQKAVEELQILFQKFQESGFNDYYKAQIDEWIDEHLHYIFTQIIKQVFFGLTSDGYFCAYVPDSWSDIVFDTGAVYGTAEYGRLILAFDAEGTHVINNTSSTLAELAEQVKTNSANIKSQLYTPLEGE